MSVSLSRNRTSLGEKVSNVYVAVWLVTLLSFLKSIASKEFGLSLTLMRYALFLLFYCAFFSVTSDFPLY